MKGSHLEEHEIFKDEFPYLASYNKNFTIRSYLNFIQELKLRKKKFFIHIERVKKIPRDVLTIDELLNKYIVDENEYLSYEYTLGMLNSLLKAGKKLETYFKKFKLNYENFTLDDLMKKRQPFYKKHLEKDKKG